MSVGGRPAIPVAVQREFWAAIRSGMVVAEAASCVGVSITVAWRWFRHVGGVMPPDFSSSPQPVTVRRLSLDECANRGFVLRPGNEVPLPVPWNRTIGGLRGTLGDVDHAGDASAPFGCPPGLAERSPGPQACHQLSAQATTALHVEAAIDRLVGDAHRLVVCVVDQQAVADLLGAVLGMQPILHVLTQPVIALEHPCLRAPGALVSQGLSHGGSIAGLAAHGPAAQLPADR